MAKAIDNYGTNEQISIQLFSAVFNKAPTPDLISGMAEALKDGITQGQLLDVLFNYKDVPVTAFKATATTSAFVTKLVDNLTAGSSISATVKAQWVELLATEVGDFASYGDFAATVVSLVNSGDWAGNADLAALQSHLAAKSESSAASSLDSSATYTGWNSLASAVSGGGATNLTLGADDLSGNTNYYAPVVQNGLTGALSNTLETGDIVRGTDGGTQNTLKADLVFSTVGGSTIPGPAISATTNNIQVVELRAQTVNLDLLTGVHGNFSTIDAENFHGVQEWWTVNSRGSIQIEDVRTLPDDTTIGMRDTDPEVGFFVYFDPEQLKNTARTENSALTLTLDDITKPGDLTDVPVDGVAFKLNGVTHILKSVQLGAAKTHAEFVTALEAAIAADAGLAGVTVKLNANNTITLQDPAGKAFEPGAWAFIDGIVPADGNIIWKQTVGKPELVDEPITTNVVLDNVGRTSVGGALDIGSLGEGGVEQFNVSVDRSSWLTSMESTSHLRSGVYAEEQHLEIVNFKSIGAKGDLTVGERPFALATAPDGRVEDGLTDVRVINGTDFAGKLNLGIVLTGNVDARYLAGATAPVQFSFDGSAQNDIFNVEVDSGIAGDPDFRLDINMGAGDDRLILATDSGSGQLKNISVDGGTGNNTFVTATSVGTSANLEFKSFQNFQNYEIEGGSTNHDFTTLNGVTSVVVATAGGANNNLIDLAANNGIVISGKNQTTGGSSNGHQTFGKIDVQGAEGATLAVKLDNTARIGGVGAGKLTVADLSVTDLPGNLSAVRTLDIESAGRRDTTNEITSIKAEKVGTFNFTGTQALTAGLDAAANSTGPAAGVSALVVDATALAGAFTLNVNSTMLNVVDTNKTASFKAGDSTKDVIDFTAGVNTTAKTSVSGFETASFHGGQFNAVNTTGVTLYKTDGAALKLTNLQGVENVELGVNNATGTTFFNAGGAQTFQTNAASNTSALNLTSKGAFAGLQEINTHGFTTLNLNLATAATQPVGQKAYNLNLEKVAVDVNGNPVVVSSGAAGTPAFVAVDDFTKANLTNIVVTGGSSTATAVADALNLNNLSATTKLLDVSGYKGVVTANIGDALTSSIVLPAATFTTGNTVVKVGSFGVNISDASHAAGAETVTTFVFTADAAKSAVGDANFQWKISDFAGINEGGAETLSNLTVLDLSGLGITGLADMIISDVGATVQIVSNTTHNFVIELTGVTGGAASLDLANFKFAA